MASKGAWEVASNSLARLDHPEVKSLTTSVAITSATQGIRRHAGIRPTPRQRRSIGRRRDALVNGRDKNSPVCTTSSPRAFAGRRSGPGRVRRPRPRPSCSNTGSRSRPTSPRRWNVRRRPAYANALLDAVAAKVQPADISADIIQAMRNLSDMGSRKDRGRRGAVTRHGGPKLIATWKNKLGVTTTAND